MEFDPLSHDIIGCGIEVHRELGPGLLESAYEHCLFYELTQNGIPARRQVALPVSYKGTRIDCGFRIDLLVNETIIVELKSVEKIQPIHEAQLLTYLRLAGKEIGLLMNFNVRRMKDGIQRFVL